jgi:hypothetical protein
MCGHVWIDCNRLRLQFVAKFMFPIYLKIELYILFSLSLSIAISESLAKGGEPLAQCTYFITLWKLNRKSPSVKCKSSINYKCAMASIANC